MIRSDSTLNRRSWLKLMGASSLGLGALSSSRLSRLARAAEPVIPRRIVFFYTQQGTLRDVWAPQGTGSNYTLGELHQNALEPYKSSLLFLNGLAMSSAEVDPLSPANAHYAGTTHALTGGNRKTATLPGGPSIDQFITQQINKDAPLTKVPSLELAARDVNGEWAVSFNQTGAPIPFEVDPGAAYDRVFGGFVAPDDAAGKARAAQDELVLQWASGEFDAMSPRLSGADRVKLQAHADALRDLQARRKLTTSNGCVKPTREGQEDVPGDWRAPESYLKISEMHLRLATAALACDLTRVVTVALPELPAELIGYTSGAHGTTDVHDLVHKTAENGVLKDIVDAVLPIKKYHQLHSQQFATLLGLLEAIPESDGQSLLDHTLVLWCGQLGSGSHDLTQLPWILAGSGGGFVKSGRHVVYPSVNNKPRAHNDLFVSLANYMGVDVQTFGNAKVCTGPLDQLT